MYFDNNFKTLNFEMNLLKKTFTGETVVNETIADHIDIVRKLKATPNAKGKELTHSQMAKILSTADKSITPGKISHICQILKVSKNFNTKIAKKRGPSHS
ncbi:hypothetical protein HC928_26330, partial [bacterium]|nr:hypothetical protein [bacterium]